MTDSIWRRALGGAAALSVAAILTTAPASAEEKWDMALAYSATNFHSEIAAEFADLVAEETGGALTIVTHPSGSLYGGGEIFGAVRRGLTPIGERLISALGNEDPLFELDSLPFLATSYEEARALYEAQKPELERILDEKGLVFLYAGPWPPQGFYTVDAAQTPADVAGVRFRAYNATTSRIASSLGMEPTIIEAAEISQAFATGLAQSMISSGATGFDRQLWEHVNFFYDARAWLPKNMVIVNKAAWEALDPEVQAGVMRAAAQAEERVWARSAELAQFYLDQFVEKGMTVEEVSPDMLSAFQAIGEELKTEWLERAGGAGQAVLDAYAAQ